MVQRQELELAVGDVFQIGDTTVTVIDIEDGEVTFRIDDEGSHDDHKSNGFKETVQTSLPR